jgi:hypothetical protein
MVKKIYKFYHHPNFQIKILIWLLISLKIKLLELLNRKKDSKYDYQLLNSELSSCYQYKL